MKKSTKRILLVTGGIAAAILATSYIVNNKYPSIPSNSLGNTGTGNPVYYPQTNRSSY